MTILGTAREARQGLGGREGFPGFPQKRQGRSCPPRMTPPTTRMEQEITDLGKEIARLERQEALEAELNRPVNKPLTGKPMSGKEES